MHLPEVICTNKAGLAANFVKKGPWYDGQRAYHTVGVDRSDCPHAVDSRDGIAWLDGWDEEASYGGWEQLPGLFDREKEAPDARSSKTE